MNTLLQLVFLILSYLIGAIPWGYVFGKSVKHIDITTKGSKNIGATNALRVLGPKIGVLVFILDAVKGALPILLMKYIIPMTHLLANATFTIPTICYGIAAFLGHLFPIYTKFKGGKGVSTAFGVLIAYTPLIGFICLIMFLVNVCLTKYVSAGSISSCVLACILSFTILKPIDWIYSCALIVLATFITIRHIPNIKRLYHDEENKIHIDTNRK